MGILGDIAAGISPGWQAGQQQNQNNADQKAALMQLAQQAQQNQQPSPQQLDQNGQPMNAQAQAAIAPFLQKLATMNQGNMAVGAAGNNPAAFQQAQQAQIMTQSPLAAIQMMMPIQQQQAALENTRATTAKDSYTPMGTEGNLLNNRTGEIVRPDGTRVSTTATGQPIIRSPIAVDANGQPIPNQGASGTSSPQGSLWGQDPTTQAGSIEGAKLYQKNLNDAQLAAQQTMLNTQGHNALFDGLRNVAPSVPWGGGVDTAQELEEKMANFNAPNNPQAAKQAQAALAWDQGQGQNMVAAVKDLVGSGGNIRPDIPLVKAIGAASGLPKTWNPQAKMEGLNSLQIIGNNNAVLANAKYQSLAQKTNITPKVIPYQAALAIAKQGNLPASKAFDLLRDRGYLVTPSDMAGDPTMAQQGQQQQ